jgi:hypothetical protein
LRPVDELVRCLEAEVERFAAGAPRADDITALALRVADKTPSEVVILL